MLLFQNLDLTPLHPILWKDLHLNGAGRPVEYEPECDLRALMLRQLEQTPYIKDLVKRLSRYKEMRSACGYGDKVPTEAHFSQMKKRVGVEGFRAIEAWLRHEALRLRKSQPLTAVGHRFKNHVAFGLHFCFRKPERTETLVQLTGENEADSQAV